MRREREWLDRADRLRPWMFPKVLRVARQWMREAVTYQEGTYPGLLLLSDVTEQAVELI